MKNLILILIIFTLTFNTSIAQWNNVIELTTSIPMVGGGDLKDINFISQDEGMYNCSIYFSPSSGSRIWIKSTNNAGNTWRTVMDNIGMGTSSYEIHTVKSQNTFYHISNWQGFIGISKTVSNGSNWSSSPLRTNGGYRDFFAVDTSHLFLLYRDYSGTKSFISKYVDGVLSTKIDSFYTENANLMFFANADIGYIGTSALGNIDNHFIYKSTAGGTNWEKVFSDSSMNIRKMFFPSPQVGYLVGDSGKIIKTADGGANWQYLNANTNFHLKSLFFLNDTVGYVAGDAGLILKTVNGGASWMQQNTGTTAGFTKIFFVNDSIGFALAGTRLHKTNQSLLSDFWGSKPIGNDLKVVPNPFSIQTILQTDALLTNATLTVYSSLGQKVAQIKNINGQAVTFNRGNLHSGLYFARLTEGNKTIAESKLVITDQ